MGGVSPRQSETRAPGVRALIVLRRRASRGSSTGTEAEQIARRYLEQHGVRISATNYRTRQGEIDIIGRDAETLVFVEVRCRSRADFGGAAESVDRRKQQRIIRTALSYLQTNKLVDKVACRFDVVCVEPDNHHRYRVEWLRDAYTA